MSRPDVFRVHRAGPPGRPPDVLIEVPHGATRGADFDKLRARLQGEFPENLKEFFFVNTDVGAPECAQEIARRVARAGRGVLLLRGLLPRTFVDCNRAMEDATGEDAARELSPALPAYVREAGDRRELIDLYRAYQARARRAYDEVCGAGGIALILHTYAPRSVRIETIDEDVVRKLRQAYEPERFEQWERRPDVDLITEDPQGRLLAPRSLVTALKREYAAIRIQVAENGTYRLYPESTGHTHSVDHPGRVLCMEINRELLADPFTPFEEMRIGRGKVERMAAPVAAALLG